MDFKNLIWAVMFSRDSEFVLSKLDVDEKLENEISKSSLLLNENKNLVELLQFYKDEEESINKAKELENYWNRIRPKTKWTYPGRPIPGDEENRMHVDPRIFLNMYDNTVPRVSGGTVDERANNILKYVIKKIVYTGDLKSKGEYWQFAYETWKRKKGDCEDGSILLANIMIRSGIPYWRIRLNAGMVQGGGHAYVTYLRESDNTWYVLDWCYWPSESIDFKKTWKNAEKYFGIWSSWNAKYVYGDLPKEIDEVREIENDKETRKALFP